MAVLDEVRIIMQLEDVFDELVPRGVAEEAQIDVEVVLVVILLSVLDR